MLCHREVPSIPIQGPARVQQGFNRAGSSTGVLRGRHRGAGRSSLKSQLPIYRVRLRKLSALSPGFRLSPCAPCDCRVTSTPTRYTDLYTSASLPATNASPVFFRVSPEEAPNKQKSSPPELQREAYARFIHRGAQDSLPQGGRPIVWRVCHVERGFLNLSIYDLLIPTSFSSGI